MALWMVRSGKHGGQENLAIEQGLTVIGWHDLGDLSAIRTRPQLASLLRKTYPNKKPKALINWEGQLWAFIKTIQDGDLVALPMKTRSVIAVGKVTGPYRYRKDLPVGAEHTRPVKWIKEFPRDSFDQDMLYSFGAFMTVCRVQRNNAEERLQAMLAGKEIPIKLKGKFGKAKSSIEPDELDVDLEQIALDQIRSHISQKYKGHDLTRLVASILEAQGYKTNVSLPGPDRGVDIIAANGPLGFDPVWSKN